MTTVPLSHNEQSQQTFNSAVATAQERIFAEVATQAQDNISLIGNIHTGNKSDNDAGGATYTKQRWIIRPLPIEFVIDVELIARKTLAEDEFNYFQRTYFGDPNKGGFLGIADPKDPNDWLEDGRDKYLAAHLETYPLSDRETVLLYDRNIRRKLGAALTAYEMSPYSKYMNTGDDRKDVRDKYNMPLMERSAEAMKAKRYQAGAHVFRNYPTAGAEGDFSSDHKLATFTVNKEGAEQEALDAFFEQKQKRRKS